MIKGYSHIYALLFLLLSSNVFSYEYDLVVIGGGLSGLQAARTALAYDKKIAIIEKNGIAENHLFGHFAVKSLSRIGSIGYQVWSAHKLNMCSEISGLLNYETVLSYIRSVMKEIQEHSLHSLLDDQRVTILYGAASFIDQHTIQVGSYEITAEKYIIAAGKVEKKLPAIIGIESVECLDIRTLFLQKRLPQSIIILGCDTLAVEIACALASIGIKVTIITKYGLLLPGFDYEVVEKLNIFMESMGVEIQRNMIAQRAKKDSGGDVQLVCTDLCGEESVFSAKTLFVSRGNTPSIHDLNLSTVGVRHSKSGIMVDSTLKTNIDTIYACGDVTSSSDQLTRIAEYQATIAGHNVFCPYWQHKMYADYIHASRIVFSTIPLASAGMTEQEAIKKYGNSLTIYRVPYDQIDRAHVDNTTLGLGKFICNKDGVLVGAHILGECAGELIDAIVIGKKLNEQFANYLFELRTPPSYFDLIWLAVERSRTSVPTRESLLHSLFQKLRAYFK